MTKNIKRIRFAITPSICLPSTSIYCASLSFYLVKPAWYHSLLNQYSLRVNNRLRNPLSNHSIRLSSTIIYWKHLWHLSFRNVNLTKSWFTNIRSCDGHSTSIIHGVSNPLLFLRTLCQCCLWIIFDIVWIILYTLLIWGIENVWFHIFYNN